MKIWTIKIKVPNNWVKKAFLGALVGFFPNIKIIEGNQND
jgi:hypothetical protein